MNPRHYDLIVLGESLAAQIAATLAARAGFKVLFLGEVPDTAPPPPFHACLHLQRLLEQLDGRSCLSPPPPRQILTGPVRLTLHGSTPLDEELQREFPNDAERIMRLLARLQRYGGAIEEVLQECGGLPLSGFSSRWRFAWRCLRRGLSIHALSRPLDRHLRDFPAHTRDALGALFAGLALTPSERLTTGEAALHWHAVASAPGVDPAALTALLRRRFEQFRGELATLAELEAIEGNAKHIAAIVLNGGIRCTADRYLLASTGAVRRLLPPGICPDHRSAVRLTGTLNGSISSLFASSITLGGSPLLQLQLWPSGQQRRLHVTALHKTQFPTVAEIQPRLSSLFPFASVDITFDSFPAAAPPMSVAPREGRSFPGAVAALKAGSNLLLCCGKSVLPGLGATGETLVGTSVASILLRSEKG